VAAFAIGGFFAGLMGGLYVQYVSRSTRRVRLSATIYMLIYVIVVEKAASSGPDRRGASHRAAEVAGL